MHAPMGHPETLQGKAATPWAFHAWPVQGPQNVVRSATKVRRVDGRRAMLHGMKKKNVVNAAPPLVVAPPAPHVELPGGVPLIDQPVHGKVPLAPREHPDARDSRGKATRTEVRHEVHRVAAPRESLRPAERSRQPRSHKSK